MTENKVKQARPSVTFDNFEANTPDRKILLEYFKKMAEELVKHAEAFINEEYPLDHARMIILHGKPGRGKTHLIEALINYIKIHAPQLLSKIFLSRSNFTHDNMTFPEDYDGLPVIIIDDIYSNQQSIQDLHPATDIDAFMKFVMHIYENRRLVIITSNFPFKDGILEKVEKVDKVKRVTSRLKELLDSSGEIEVGGEDFRETIAKNRKVAKLSF